MLKKILKHANQLLCLSLLLLGMSLILSKGTLAPGFGIVIVGMAIVYAAYYVNKNGKKKKKGDTDYFF